MDDTMAIMKLLAERYDAKIVSEGIGLENRHYAFVRFNNKNGWFYAGIVEGQLSYGYAGQVPRYINIAEPGFDLYETIDELLKTEDPPEWTSTPWIENLLK